jgi:hypothetical protein
MNQHAYYDIRRDWPELRPDEIIPGLWMGGAPDDGYADFEIVIDLEHEQPGCDFDGEIHLHWGIDDGAFMPDEATAIALAKFAADCVRLGAKTLIHCSAGLNRSGLITALTLQELGYQPRAAIALIREKRSAWALCNRTFERWLLRDETAAIYADGSWWESALAERDEKPSLWRRITRRIRREPAESALAERERERWNTRFIAEHQARLDADDLARFDDDGGVPADADQDWWEAALAERESYADAYQARLDLDDRNTSAARARSRWMEIRGDFDAAAEECPHDGGYPLKSPAAEWNRDPHAGEPGVRCHDCGSRLTTWPWHNGRVIAPCEFKADESAA